MSTKGISKVRRGPILEDEFQQQIVDLCVLLKLLCYHTYDSRRSVEGYPDLTIVGPGGMLMAELKKQDGRVTVKQKEWIEALRLAGIEVHVWRPSDLEDIRVRLHHLADRAFARPQNGSLTSYVDRVLKTGAIER